MPLQRPSGLVFFCMFMVHVTLLSQDITQSFERISLLEEQLARLKIAKDEEQRKKD